jgi:hypothetical protein
MNTTTWTDLATNAPGIGIAHEAARRRKTEGAGADRSWRLGADGEQAVAALLAELTTVSPLGRLRHPGRWRVLHSVPIGPRPRDLDHLAIGPPGVVTINTRHHPDGRLVLDGDALVVNGYPTDAVAKARREARVARSALAAALREAGRHDLAERMPVRPVIAVVGGLLHAVRWPPDVTVVTSTTLVHTLSALPTRLDGRAVAAIYDVARRSTTWLGG